MQIPEHPLKGWIPYKLVVENKTPIVYWLYVGDKIFNEPFFDETILACKSCIRQSTYYNCVSNIDCMINWADTLPDIVNVNFIFHVSRCGSTLLSQLIGLDEKHIVLAEVPLFDEILRLSYRIQEVDDTNRRKILSAAIKFMGQKRTGAEEQIFIKTDSWHICFYKIYRQLYPLAPVILLFRSPDEVVYSHKKIRGMQAVPGIIEPEVFGFNKQKITELTLDAYIAKVLEKYILLFKEIAMHDKLALLMDYKQGTEKMMKQLAVHANINWSEEHFEEMKNRSKFHSKYSQQSFEKENKPAEIPMYLQAAMKLYNRLVEKNSN